MSLEVLIAELTREAEREADQIRSAAVEQARLIQHTAEDQARQRRDTELARLEASHRLAVARDTAAAVRSNRLALLEARYRFLDQVFARAAAMLTGTDAARYRAGIGALVGATTRYLEGTPAELRCRPDVSAAVVALSDRSEQVRVVPSDDANAGLLGRSTDGRIVVDNTLPALLARRRAELEVAVARRLEEE
jgi:vacuolar-type H+-ATPase subunit E/Vma4